jgi:hypothetical protein
MIETVNAQGHFGRLGAEGFCFVKAESFKLSPETLSGWQDFRKRYDDLPLDEYLPERKKYRRRRYGEFEFNANTLALKALPSKAFYQGKEINKAAGGIQRVFAPLHNTTCQNCFLMELIAFDFTQLPVPAAWLDLSWKIGIHMIRIIAKANEPGLPAPEGVHRDGHDFVAQHLIKRQNIVGGVSVLFDNDEKPLDGFNLTDPLDTAIIDDNRIKHFATPIRPWNEAYEGIRDMLLIDYEHSIR